jgi:hypothetical protein
MLLTYLPKQLIQVQSVNDILGVKFCFIPCSPASIYLRTCLQQHLLGVYLSTSPHALFIRPR